MADEEWSSNSTEVTTVSLWQPGRDSANSIFEFGPAFTYPIFGDEESIFGYRNLKINISFAAHNLWPNVSWAFDEKFDSVGETEALNLEETLTEFVPDYALSTVGDFKKHIQEEDSSRFVPPGEKLRTWTKDGRHYEIWSGQLTNPSVRTLVERIQVLVPLFIEGGTELRLDDQDWTIARWRVFFLYEKLSKPPTPTSSVYSFVGYSTTYRFVAFEPKKWSLDDKSRELLFSSSDDFDVLSLPYRGRISQFLVLPPHAHQGHGSMLYATIFKHFHDDSSCIEITVEDPNEAFDDLRDYCDFTQLLQTGTLEKIRMNHNIDPKLLAHANGRCLPTNELVNKELLTTIKRESKIAPRQFKRLVELWLLSRIPAPARQAGIARLTRKAKTADEGDRAFYFWRLLVKQRIWNQNKDKLKDLEQSEAVKHLEDTVENLVADYERLLLSLAEKAVSGATNDVDEGSSENKKRGKRNLIVEDEDDEENDGGRTKRAKSVIEA